MLLHLSTCTVDLSEAQVHRDGHSHRLTELEVGLLRYLVQHADRAVSRDELHREVWGYAAGVHSRAADFSMSRLRKKVEENAADPRHLRSVRGEGYRFVPTRQASSIPVPQTPFFGRQTDQVAVSAALGAGRLVSLLGTGGVGKTRLAVEVARQQVEAGRAVVFCELTAARSLTQAADLVADTLGLPPRLGDRRAQVGLALAARGDLLLLLDNLEQVDQTGAPLVQDWLAASDQLQILVTSRDRLRLQTERVVDLGPLDHEAAVALFLDRARAVRPGLSDPDPAIGEIVTAVEALPLALALTAARCRLFSPPQLLQRMCSKSSLPAMRQHDRPTRHQTLRDAISWSWELLAPWERALLAQCAVFPDGLGLDAAERVVDLGDFPDAPHVIDALMAQCDRSLCRIDESGAQTRLRLYASVRDFASTELPDQVASARVRWLDWALDEARTLAKLLSEARAPDVADRLVRERANLIEAWQMSPAASTLRDGLATALMPVLAIRGPWSVLREMVSESVNGSLEARLASVHALRVLGDYPAAVVGLKRLINEEIPTHCQILVHIELAANVRRQGQLSQAASLLERALELEKTASMPVQRGRAQTILGLIRSDQERPDQALSLHRAALSSFLEVGAVQYESTARTNLGARYRQAHRWQEAREQHRLAHGALRHVGSPRVEALLLHDQVQLELEAGALEKAAALGDRELSLLRSVGDQAGEAWCLANLASLSLELGRLDEADRRLELALALHGRTGSRPGQCVVWANQGILAALRGQRTEALMLLTRTVDMAQTLGAGTFLVLSLGYLTVLRGDPADLARARSVDALGRWRAFLDVSEGGIWLAQGALGRVRALLAEVPKSAAQDVRLARNLLAQACLTSE